MERKPEVYLFGQVLGTHSFLLKDGFLRPDEYAEISAQYFLPFEAYLTAGAFYLVLTFLLLQLFKAAERRWLAHLRPQRR